MKERSGKLQHWFLLCALLASLIALQTLLSGCAGGPLSTREWGALIGAGGGAGVGAIVGSQTGHPGAGAAIGGALGLGAGALIGDQLQGRDNRQLENEQRMRELELEIERLKREQEHLRQQR